MLSLFVFMEIVYCGLQDTTGHCMPTFSGQANNISSPIAVPMQHVATTLCTKLVFSTSKDEILVQEM